MYKHLQTNKINLNVTTTFNNNFRKCLNPLVDISIKWKYMKKKKIKRVNIIKHHRVDKKLFPPTEA